ncbi:retrovirus-related Pol polyprotein from type-2 retrotransposable element R2DM, partial [Nephila pilipes]
TKKPLLQVNILKKFSPPGSAVTGSSPLSNPSSILTEVADVIQDMVETTCHSSPSPKIPIDKSSPSVTPVHVSQCPSPMGSPDAYLLRLGSPIANDCSGKTSPTILLHSNLILQQLPTILSPIPSPPPPSPTILEFILDKQDYLSDCSPEAPHTYVSKIPLLQNPISQDHSPLTFSTSQEKSPIHYTPQVISPITFTAMQDRPPKSSSSSQDKPSSPLASSMQINSSAPPPCSQNIPKTTSSGLSFLSYADAAKSGRCKICNASFPPAKLLTHLTSHRPCTKRYKCIKAWTLLFNSHSTNSIKPQPSSKQPQSQLETTFREKFPDLAVFKNGSSSSDSSSSSPEKFELLKQLNSPPSGPPTIPAFTKPLYSKIVKKGLFRCRFCEAPFVSKIGLERHLLKVHDHPTIKPTTSLFPENNTLPTCRTCFRTVEDGLSLADHCRLYHNLEISTDRSLPSTAIVKISPSITNPPSVRHVTESKPSKNAATTLSVGLSFSSQSLPGPQKPLTFLNSNLKNGKKIFSNKHTLPSTTPHSDSEDFVTKKTPSTTRQLTVQPSTSTNLPASPRKCPHCPFIALKKIGLRLHLFKIHNIKAPSKSNTDDHPPSTTIEQPPSCPVCGISTKTAKGLRVHMQQAHKISVSKPGKPISPVPAPSPPVSTSPPAILAPAPSRSPATTSPPHSSIVVPRAEDLHLKGTSVSLSGSTLKYLFPLEETLICPVKNCVHSFHTQKWYTTNSSLKKHLLIYHRIQLQTVEHWCSICKSIIKTRPAIHPCIQSSLTAPPSKASPSKFRCSSCNFNATTQIALFLHQRMHKKESLASSAVPLKSFPTPKERKSQKKRKLAPLLQGSPGNHPIAPPLIPFTSIPQPDPADASNSSPVELIQLEEPLLASFVEPLGVLFEDGIDNKMALLENLLHEITSIIQGKFNLSSENLNNRPKRNNPNRLPRSSESQDAQAIQKAYNWNRRKCIRNLINPSNSRCSLKPDTLFSFFSNIWNNSDAHSIPDFGSPPDLPPVVEHLTEELVKDCLQAAENTAPGPDGIAYKHWREVDPTGKILCMIFNLCLQLRRIPDSWKFSNTILIHKKGDTSDPSNWRPISLSNTIYKIFTKCLTRKLGDWCSFHQRLSPNQKGFLPFDGVLEHNFIIAQHLESASRLKKEALSCWLDLSNAFGSIHHDILLAALSATGADSDFVALVHDIYTNSSSSILCEEGTTAKIPCNRGVKQGCPLSGLLFNIAIDSLLRTVQGDAEHKKILAFADDLVLLADTPEELQNLLDLTTSLLEALNLE